jgi:hypothetical protein
MFKKILKIIENIGKDLKASIPLKRLIKISKKYIYASI